MAEPVPADRMLHTVAASLRRPPADPDADADYFADMFDRAAERYEAGHRDPLVQAVINLAAHLIKATVVRRAGP